MAVHSKIVSRELILNLLGIVIGNIIYAVGVVLFIIPHGLITGGSTGIAIIFNHHFGIDISLFVLIFNFSMFILGAIFLGRKFAMSTLISTITYPLALQLLQIAFADVVLTYDIMLNTIFAGLFIGVAIGIVIKCGASSGGMDIPPLLIQKQTGISVAVTLYIFDFFILLFQASFQNAEALLFGICLVIIYTFMIEKVIVFGKQRIQVQIISSKEEEIRHYITNTLDRGVTIINAKTGYLNRDCGIIMSVISSRELARLSKAILAIDPDIFMVISTVKEVSGRGFTNKKKHLAHNDLKNTKD